jgi:hypothetical protein
VQGYRNSVNRHAELPTDPHSRYLYLPPTPSPTCDVARSVCMFSGACVDRGRLVLFIPPDIEIPPYGDQDDSGDIFSPASFADAGGTMLYSSPNWWESAWLPAVVRG